MKRLLRKLRAFLRLTRPSPSQRPIAAASPWLSDEQVRAGFDAVRAQIPVDDDELARAKPARPLKLRIQ